MSDTDPATLVEITSEVVSAYMAKNHVQQAEIPALIASVHAAFLDLGRPTPKVAAAAGPVPAVPVNKSITDDFIVSLENGKRYKSLKRHLGKLGMTPDQYRAKWGLTREYPMVAPAYGRARSKMAKTRGLGQMRQRR